VCNLIDHFRVALVEAILVDDALETVEVRFDDDW
jgi:hypothetical protein